MPEIQRVRNQSREHEWFRAEQTPGRRRSSRREQTRRGEAWDQRVEAGITRAAVVPGYARDDGEQRHTGKRVARAMRAQAAPDSERHERTQQQLPRAGRREKEIRAR